MYIDGNFTFALEKKNYSMVVLVKFVFNIADLENWVVIVLETKQKILCGVLGRAPPTSVAV